jgi:hypothetical protein
MQHQCTVCHRAALLTCITNAGGLGPGHSCLAIDGYVYTFERVGGAWLRPDSGWLQIRTKDYLDRNAHRPVVVQELDPARTDATAIHDYITLSDAEDADYLSSGLCSQQAAKALSAGLGVSVDPWGLDSPYRIYSFVKHSGCVAKSYYTFPDRDEYTPLNGRKMILYNLYTPEWQTHLSSPTILAW